MKKYSIIVPVFNRPDEVQDLLVSLKNQSFKDFEIILVEDGSTNDCKDIVHLFKDDLDIKYFFKSNSGPGDSRNFGMAKTTGKYLIFFDSDCVIPANYFKIVDEFLAKNHLDAYGGPDSADASFSNIQKAINYAMTSVITTGGVRGKENKLDNFQPRSFNMGISREVYEKVGGYGDNFRKFIKQVYKFGVVRPILIKWYPEKFKITYTFPSIFLLGSVLLALLALTLSFLFLLPLALLACILFLESFLKTKHIGIAFLSVFASFIQLYGYGFGFLHSSIKILILKLEERKVFKDFFFNEN